MFLKDNNIMFLSFLIKSLIIRARHLLLLTDIRSDVEFYELFAFSMIKIHVVKFLSSFYLFRNGQTSWFRIRVVKMF